MSPARLQLALALVERAVVQVSEEHTAAAAKAMALFADWEAVRELRDELREEWSSLHHIEAA